jgi:hypothetical protein
LTKKIRNIAVEIIIEFMDRRIRPYSLLPDAEKALPEKQNKSNTMPVFKYGDAIHLARAMANTFSDEYFDAYDDCMDLEIRERVVESNYMVKIYPNPSSGVFTVELPEGFIGQLTVTDVLGRVVQSQRINKQYDSILHLQDYPGVLFMQISDYEGYSSTHKIIVVR